VDLGYQVDGTYAIVLSGRVATGNSQAQGLPSGGSTARDVAGVYVISKEGSQPMFKVSLKAIGKKDLAATFVGNEPGWDFDKPQFDLAKLDDGVIHIHWTTMDRDGGSDDFNITFDSESGQGMYHHTIRDVSLGHAVVRHSAFEVTAKRR
jgi:hypothetical protein